MLYRLLRDYVSNGKALTEVFAILAARKRDDKDPDYVIFETLSHLVRDKNIGVFAALRQLLPVDEVLLIEAYPGHVLREGFEQARQLAESKKEIGSTIKSMLALPVLSLIIGFSTLYILLREQVPLFTSILPVELWDTSSRGVLVLYAVFVDQLHITVAIITAIVCWIVFYSLRQPTGGHRRYLDQLPPWSIQRDLQATSFLGALGAMFNQRVSLPDAVSRIAQVAPVYLKSHLLKVSERLRQNQKPGRALSVDLFDRETSGYIRDFIDRPSFGDTLMTMAVERQKSLKQKITSFSMIIGVVIILAINGINAYVAYTGFSLNQQVKEYYSR
jgi:type II secretory pathway component PulF